MEISSLFYNDNAFCMNRYTLVSKDDQICFDIDVFYLEILFGIEMAW